MRLQLLVFIIMYLNLTSGQDAIVSEITRHTSPTGQSAFVHHRRQFSQKLQHKGQFNYQSSLSDESASQLARNELNITSFTLGVGSDLISVGTAPD